MTIINFAGNGYCNDAVLKTLLSVKKVRHCYCILLCYSFKNFLQCRKHRKIFWTVLTSHIPECARSCVMLYCRTVGNISMLYCQLKCSGSKEHRFELMTDTWWYAFGVGKYNIPGIPGNLGINILVYFPRNQWNICILCRIIMYAHGWCVCHDSNCKICRYQEETVCSPVTNNIY